MSSIISKRLGFATVLIGIVLVEAVIPTSTIAASTTLKPANKVHQVLKASQQHPQMAIPGDTIDVTLKTGVTTVQLLGPVIPQVTADALPGTFTFTFRQRSGKTLISVNDFGILDGEATLIRPVQFDNATKSFYLSAGQTRTVKMTEFMAVGTGTLRWAPLKSYVIDWQFVEETA